MKTLGKMAKMAAAAVMAAGMAAPGMAQEKAKVVMDGSTTVGPIAKAFAEAYMKACPEVNVTVGESGSGNGAKSLINNTCDIANMSRFMKDNEFEAAVAKKVLPVAHVVAMDGLAVIIHPSNPVANLTVQQVYDIYTGKVTSWKAVGGPDMPIVVISRDTNSGTYETFEELVLKKAKIVASAEYVGSNGAIRQRVQTTRGAIGYVGLGFVDKTVKAVKINHVEANNETVASGKYPIARPLFMFTNGYPKLGSHVHALVTMHLSKQGQEIIEKIGYVPVTSY
ncbi:MAG TPA: phosphate ABC transporter substrate-binding protein [Candidatus Brocadiia bacterium]|nr:phosphate ABC transporter substrate-binding protein [Candidatus Brocadiia bacterium]